jgi:hypothetical protein
MTVILRMLEDLDKVCGLNEAVRAFRTESNSSRIFIVEPQDIQAIPGSPFAYWASEAVLRSFSELPPFDGDHLTARQGLATADDFRFLRVWWECSTSPGTHIDDYWKLIAKGGVLSPFYSDVYLAVNWKMAGKEVAAFVGSVIRNVEFYFRPGLTWPRRTKSRLSMRVLPLGCIFADKGPAIFAAEDDTEELLATLSLCASDAFFQLVKLQLAAADVRAGGAAHSFEVGVIKRSPIPQLEPVQRKELADLARTAWSIRRTIDTVVETSHAFLLPAALRARLAGYDAPNMEQKLVRIQIEIDKIAFALYGFGEAGRDVVPFETAVANDDTSDESEPGEETEDDEITSPVDQSDGLLSWAVGVVFGHFDWRLATGERIAPPEPDPFEPLPAKSAGMLPDSADPFHIHTGILVDDPGHPHDLAHWAEEVLARVDVPVPFDVRRWLQRDFFPFHLQNYSKSRRKAPIYWPLSTASGVYTLWLYYPGLTSQTLYKAVNDLIEGPNGKLKQVEQEATALHNKGSARSRDEDKKLEALQLLRSELVELRDTLLQIAPTYRPDRDDGVQITAAPLWPLFRHKPWQKLLKDTWTKLEKGDYDWAHLAMAYWPERVREKCKTDKSLAIAHDLEQLYVEPAHKPAKTRGKKGAGA